MSEIAFYRWSSTLPLVLVLPGYLIGLHVPPPRGVFSELATFVAAAGVAAGVPYIPFMSVLLWCLRRKSTAVHRVASLVAPILFVPVFILFALVIEFGPGPDFVHNVKFYVPYLLGVGFGYVVLIHLLRFALSFGGWLDDGDPGAV